MPTTSADRQPPTGYEPPEDDPGDSIVYYLAPQPNYDGATPLFVVMRRAPGAQSILAERCYRELGMEIVDALRFVQSHATT